MLNQEFEYYLKNQKRFSKKYQGKFLTIIDKKLSLVSNTYAQAYAESKKKYELGTFLIQEANIGIDNFTIHVGTNASF